MTPCLGWAFHAFHLAMLRAASLLVPLRRREDWWREWRNELWHVRREQATERTVRWRAEHEVTAFCRGAFRDALCLRRETGGPETAHGSVWGSPGHCIFGFAAVLSAGFAVALLLPGVRAVSGAPRFRINPGLILIRSARSDDAASTISREEFRRWTARRQRYFDEFAFYSVSRERIWAGSPAETQWPVAHASANLFAMLGVPLRFALPADGSESGKPVAILSCAAFEREFGGHAQSVWTTVRIGQMDVRLGGVAPCGGWALPGDVDAWLLEPGSALAADTAGYVVAHLTPQGQAAMTGSRVAIAEDGADDADSYLWGDALEGQARGPWDIYLFSVLLAFLALPAVTSVTMGETSFSSQRPSMRQQLRRRGFLAAKIVLLLPIVWCVPVDLAYWHAASSSAAAQYVQLIASFSICLLGMRWILLDQRRRCPVCLRRVSNPARVGDASRTFLGWNGTEMMCLGGHTLLHVPGLPTSWFATQRWLYLDRSWEFLFAGSSEG